MSAYGDVASPDGIASEADATAAVMAHGLLGNLAVVRGVARLLTHDDGLAAGERARLLEMLDSQVDLMQGVLTDLVRGLPTQALKALDELGQR
jgi:hypothetical protein